MEPVTHFLTGACLGRAGFNRKTAYATLAMTFAAEAPDIDVLWGFGGPVTGFCHHRGITHTLVGAPFMALADLAVVWWLVWLLRRCGRRPPVLPVRWGWLWLLCLVADLSHLLLDYTNNYGLRPFFPFDPHWYAWSIVFIFDPILFAMLLLGLALPALFGLVEGEMRRPVRGRLPGRGWAATALCGVFLLYALRNAEHLRAEALTRQNGSATQQQALRVAAEPSMANPFVWHTLLQTQGSYQEGTAYTLDGSLQPGAVLAIPPATPAVAAARQSYLGRVYDDWSSWPLIEDIGAEPPPGDGAPLPEGAQTVRFSDLRFDYGVASGHDVLSGWVIVAPGGQILGQWMNGREQR